MEGNASFLTQLFRTVGFRLGNAIERYYYDAMRHYPADVVLPDDLLERTDKDFEVKRWLEGDPDRHVTSNDIWDRLRCGRDDLGNLKNANVALLGHLSAVVASRGLVRAFIVMQFIGF